MNYSIRKIFKSKSNSKIVLMSRYILWQLIKILNLFPREVKFSNSSIIITNKKEANAGGGILFTHKLYDYNNMNFIKMIFDKFDFTSFFDIGANKGIYSLLVSESQRSIVYSFEPHPSTFKQLEENIILNKRKNIYAFNIAISSSNGLVKFTDYDSSTINRVVNNNDINYSNLISVQSKTLDSFCFDKKIYPEILKIDVEGFEYEVLQGGKETLSHAEIILVEITKNMDQIFSFLSTKNFYGPFYFDFNNVELNTVQNEDPIFLSKYFKEKLITDLNMKIYTS